jgi:hypothetical protein
VPVPVPVPVPSRATVTGQQLEFQSCHGLGCQRRSALHWQCGRADKGITGVYY